MKKFYCLFALLFSSYTWGNGAYHDVSFNFNTNNAAPGGYAQYDITPISISPLAPFKNYCASNGNGSPGQPYYTCQTAIVVYTLNASGGRHSTIYSGSLLDTKITGARPGDTIGELVPAMQLFGGFGKTSSSAIYYSPAIVGYQTCIVHQKIKNGVISAFQAYDCGPAQPLKTTCNITDSNAIVDFGTFGNDEKTRRANGSFRIDCSNDAFMRIKFSSNVDNIVLSEDKKLSVSLKIRDSTPGNSSMESLIKVPGGGVDVFIDGELKNDNSSHAGPFSASVVAIVDIV
ncbi:Uncharacterised protein [Serratia ficaria]|uniref:hypothetical protein n=1 Tax=Serratia ficaria TaxID=61651 RepID=UPI00217B5C2B|nr:hypothetical protein [Serratia ficaria]CAI2151647.1 Uncharacterised protein [Serratia ficaria]CAI2484276.1 Uncharacterised protein [Serratia ficaria]